MNAETIEAYKQILIKLIAYTALQPGGECKFGETIVCQIIPGGNIDPEVLYLRGSIDEKWPQALRDITHLENMSKFLPVLSWQARGKPVIRERNFVTAIPTDPSTWVPEPKEQE